MAVNTQNINAKSVLGYALLPGIIPRAKELGNSGFGYLAFLFAHVYQAVRILPVGHPYLNAANIGNFSVFQVMAAAANNLEISKRNIDQIIVFVALLVGIILMFLQFILIIFALFSTQAYAGGGGGASGFTSMFETQYPQTDVAFLMLDYVFGIPLGGGMGPSVGFFGSLAIPTGPTPFHMGLHALFNFYNFLLLLIAVVIFLYYVIVVVIETAQTGVPFGHRFAKIYAPIRLIIAIGLLVPLNYGFNGAQYITLYAASMGSSFATNGWILYNRALTNPLGINNNALVARPRAPADDELLYFSSVYHACREMYKIWSPREYMNPNQGTEIKPYVVVNGRAEEFESYDYEQAKKDFGVDDMEVVLGEYDAAVHSKFAGGVRPYCGKLTVSLSNNNPVFVATGGPAGAPPATMGVRAIEKMYYERVRLLLTTAGIAGSNKFVAFGERAAHSFVSSQVARDTCWRSGDLGDAGSPGCDDKWDPPSDIFQQTISAFRTEREGLLSTYYTDYLSSLNMKLSGELEKRGWGGAGIWFNNIADINGTYTSAIYAVPTIRAYPEVMEYVKKKLQEKNKKIATCDIFTPNLSDAQKVVFAKTSEADIANALNQAYKYFACEKQNQEAGGSAPTGGAPASPAPLGGSIRTMTGNVFVDAIQYIFGLNGLFDLAESSQADPTTGQPRVHPLAQLTTIGKSLVENSIRSMAMAIGASFGGGLLSAMGSHLGAALNSLSGMFVGIATIGLTAGFVLYYILPFLPFIYFFFAVGAWVKSIFEAMVGVPLCALAHLKIDGPGLSGEAGKAGYLLIFEIFLRPIAILFGLIGGMATFSAMAVALNVLFELAVVNTAGSPETSTATITMSELQSLRRGTIDMFFFTIMYAILLYMMGTASFKMIDSIPKYFMRWLGGGVSTFDDNKGDPAGNLTQYAALGGSQVSQQVLGGIQQGAQVSGSLLGALGKGMSGEKKK